MKIRLFALLFAVAPCACNADVILTYTGAPFLSGATSAPFINTDLITGTATFTNAGDSTPTAATLTTTVGGGAGFSLFATPTELTAATITWNGTNTTIAAWDVNLTGEAFGSAALSNTEFLGISNLLNDQASIDNFASNGLSTAAGSWSTVPEPSAFLFLGFVGVLSIGWSRWTRRVKTVK